MFGSETSNSEKTTMEHLIDSGLVNRIHANLAESRQIRSGYGTVLFNTFVILLIIGGAITFLVIQYHHSKTVLQPVNIEKRELIWNNSIRNNIEL